jgi:hypothetical protein
MVGRDRVCAVLDDLSDEIVTAAYFFDPGALIHRINAFNEGEMKTGFFAHDLNEATIMIQERIARWKAEHESAHH